MIDAKAGKPFRSLCEAMGEPALTDEPRYATHEARGRHQAKPDTLPAAHGVPAGPLNSVEVVK